MAYSRYATEMKDGDNNIYGLMDEEAREQLSDLNSALNDTYSKGLTLIPTATTADKYATIGNGVVKLVNRTGNTAYTFNVSTVNGYYVEITTTVYDSSTYNIQVIFDDKTRLTASTTSEETVRIFVPHGVTTMYVNAKTNADASAKLLAVSSDKIEYNNKSIKNGMDDINSFIDTENEFTKQISEEGEFLYLIERSITFTDKSVRTTNGQVGTANNSGKTTFVYDVSGMIGDVVLLSGSIPAGDTYGIFYAISEVTTNNLLAGGVRIATAQSYSRLKIKIPTGAKYLYVTSISTSLPVVEGLTNKMGSQIAEIYSKLQKRNLTAQFVFDNQIDYVNGGSIHTASASGYTCYVFDVQEHIGQTIHISNDYDHNSSYGDVFCIVQGTEDTSYEILYTKSEAGEHDDFVVTIPTNAYRLFVNTMSDTPATAMYYTIDVSNNPLFGKTAVTFGDSITWYDGHEYTWGKEDGVVAKGYQTYMRAEGMTVTNKGYDGHNLIDIVEDKILTTNFDGFDYVTITSGANDSRYDIPVGEVTDIGATHDASTFIGALQTAIEYILTDNAEIKILLMTPIRGWIYYPMGYPSSTRPHHSADGIVEEKYADAIKTVAKVYGIPVCDWYNLTDVNIYTREWFMNDPEPDPSQDPNPNTLMSCHPSTKGYKRMADVLIPVLKSF